ncbi:putative G protein-coupled glucose receptor regulating Gpa2-domain-containing protein [Seiridium cardinale]|uniref:G protein-coupled glucose receptor regulating Gpa2-domain-containing protein n=1 Tax=Seiridium cardinale TaxID=138064 RepID=A0ABR2X5B3_9PEZI
MATNSNGVPLAYYESPNSLLNMDSATYGGLLAIGCLATLSVLFTSVLLSFISWRMIAWKSHYTSFIGRNQPIVLIYQLILADFLQSLGFLLSFHWASNREIIGPNGECFAQGWLIQLGDVASAFFVLAIAVHTTYQVMFSRSVSYRLFVYAILGVWTFAVLLTSLAPIIGGRYIFLRAGMWCWISGEHESLRLLLHYLWIFIVQFSSIIVYMTGFYHLYRTKGSGVIRINGASDKAVRRASTAMLAYALIYTLLTLPLAAGRMAAMSADNLPEEYYLFAGALFTSSGWVDTALYAITRRTLLFKELDPHSHPSMAPTGRSTNLPRQSSTDSILAQTGFGGANGIVMDRTVKIELDDMESQGDSEHEGKSYFVSAKALRK